MNEDAGDAAGPGVEVLVGTPGGEVGGPGVQGEGDVADCVG